jgi:inactivated superfamily I helicase/RecB family exonuclease
MESAPPPSLDLFGSSSPDHDPWLGWAAPGLPAAAGRLVDAGASEGVADLRGTIAVVPGGRAGRRLKELLVEAADERGLRLVPPEIVTAGRLPELLFDAERPLADPATCRLAWIRALREAPTDRLARVWSRVEQLDSADAWAALARDVQALHREVAAGGHRFSDVVTICGDPSSGLNGDDSPRWRILADLQATYADLLERFGLSDPDLARIEALEESRIRTDRDVWLICVPELPNVALRMLAEVEPRVRPLVHAPATMAELFGRFGTVRAEAWSVEPLDLDDASLVVVDGPAEQAAATVEVLASRSHELAAEDVAIGVPDEALTPWLAEALGAAGAAVRDAAGRKIEDSGPWRALTAVADFVDGRRYDRFAALVRHPDVDGWLKRSFDRDPGVERGSWLGAMDRWYAVHLPATMPEPGGRPTVGTGRGRDDARVVNELMDHLDARLLDELTSPSATRPVRDWTPALLAVLRTLYRSEDLDHGNRADRRLARALGVLGDAARAFGEVPAGLDTDVPPATAIRMVLQQAAGETVPSDPDTDAVELLGWLEMHPDDARLKIVTGVNEPFLPRAVRGDAFLPDALRTKLGLVDDATRYARDLYRLRAMLKADGEVVLVTARRSGRGDPLRPSRLLFAADAETVARRIRRIHDRGDQSAARPSLAEAPLEHTRSDFPVPPVREIASGRAPEVLSVTDFSSLIADPYRFAIGKYVKADVVRDDAREMDALQFGTFAHAVLQTFGRSDAVDSDDVDLVRERLDDHLDTEFRARFLSRRQRPHVSVQLQVEQLRARLHAFASVHVGRIRSGWRVVGVERTAGTEGVPFDVDGTPVRIRGTIDRIERHVETGAWAVFDYKTSGTATPPEKVHLKGERWVDLQLPMYRWLLPRLPDDADAGPLPGPDDPIEVGYISLPRDTGATRAHVAAWGAADYETALDAAREAIRDARELGFVWDPDRRAKFVDEEVERVLGRGVLVAHAAHAAPSTHAPEGGR